MSIVIHTEARLQELDEDRVPVGQMVVVVDEDGEPVGSFQSTAVPAAGDTVSVYAAGDPDFKAHKVLRRDFAPHGFVVVVERTRPIEPFFVGGD